MPPVGTGNLHRFSQGIHSDVHCFQARPASAQVLTVHQTAPLPATHRPVVSTPAEPLPMSGAALVRDGQLEAASHASLRAMSQACQAADS